MATEHYCSIHGKVFFKKGKMRGYAHPIQDENGEDTGEWCNEDAKEVAKLEPKKPEPVPLQTGEEPIPKTKEQLIAEYVWFKELGEWLRIWEQWPVEKRPKSFKAIKNAYFAFMWSVLSIKIEDK